MQHPGADIDVREPVVLERAPRFPSIVSRSMAMRRLLATVARIAPKDVTVLVRGETGTGKELISSLVHAQSRRSQVPLVRFNCAAIPGGLAEAELFGHAQGAFTGATHARRGFFAQAHGGTLVLDEVGELPLAIQAKLLRALQEGEIQPVGNGRVERVDVRVIACTNRDLAADVRARRFREDLYYRLAVVELLVPPLREHPEDIPALAREFALRYGKRFGAHEVRLSPALIEALSQARWPGNVRQLENEIARMVALRSSDEIDVEAFAAAPAFVAAAGPGPSRAAGPEAELSLPEQVEALERRIIARTMDEVAGNQSEAARRLGLNRGALIARLKKYGLARPTTVLHPKGGSAAPASSAATAQAAA
jgi:two-component system, NtrC family, response regulator AtoC